MAGRLIWTALIFFFVVSTNAQSQQPNQQTLEQDTQQSENHKEISSPQNTGRTAPVPLLPLEPPKELKQTAEDAGKHKEDGSYQSWRDILNNPGDFFVGVVAVLTFLLVVAGFYQAGVARAATRKQLRAYVFVDAIRVANMIAPPPGTTLPANAWVFQPNIGPIVTITIKNSGQTPAYNAVHWGNICFQEFSPLPELPRPDRSVLGPKTMVAMPPGGITSKVLKMAQPLSNNEIAKLHAGTHAIYVHGNIVYKDAFGKNRYSNFRYFINGLTGFTHLSNYMIGCEHGNEAN